MAKPTHPEPPAEVLSQYCTAPERCVFRLIAGGNINQTYLVEGCGRPFVLQRIADTVFPRPERVVQNFLVISRHLQEKMQRENLPVTVVQPRFTEDGNGWCFDSSGALWRALLFIPHASPPLNLLSHRSLGRLLSTFHYLLDDLDCSLLQEALPGFHDLAGYLRKYDKVIAGWSGVANSDIDYGTSMVERLRPLADEFVRTLQVGELLLQPVHGDPKLENVLFDKEGRALALIDLDTVGPGCIQYDLGDCLRSCCNLGGEKARRGDVRFDLESCQALLSGYLESPFPKFTADCKNAIYDGLLLVSFELGLRFFSDYLVGNRYFRVSHPAENLQRAINQFRLVESIISQERTIRGFLK